MSGCNFKIPDKLPYCEIEPTKGESIEMEQLSQRHLRVTKIIYNYKGKTEKQIRDSIQLEIETFLINWPDYKFVNSKSHFNRMGGIEMQLNFELK